MFNLQELLQEAKRRQTEGGCFKMFFTTEEERLLYGHWIEFFEQGQRYHERLALCANQVGV